MPDDKLKGCLTPVEVLEKLGSVSFVRPVTDDTERYAEQSGWLRSHAEDISVLTIEHLTDFCALDCKACSPGCPGCPIGCEIEIRAMEGKGLRVRVDEKDGTTCMTMIHGGKEPEPLRFDIGPVAEDTDVMMLVGNDFRIVKAGDLADHVNKVRDAKGVSRGLGLSGEVAKGLKESAEHIRKMEAKRWVGNDE